MNVCICTRAKNLHVRSPPKRNFNQNWKIEETYFSFPAAAASAAAAAVAAASVPFRP